MKLLTAKVQDLQMMPYEEWKRKVLPKLGEDNPIYPMIKEYFGRRSWFPARDAVVDCAKTINILRENYMQFEEISEDILMKWFDFVIEYVNRNASKPALH